jgi:large subunit ribosomal protein L15
MPLQRRLPKRGFRPVAPRLVAVVNLRDLAAFPAGTVVDAAVLRASGLVRRRRPVKVLGDGTLEHPLTVRAQAFSARAKERIAAAGGSAEVVDDA